jgi:hypothetical protein
MAQLVLVVSGNTPSTSPSVKVIMEEGGNYKNTRCREQEMNLVVAEVVQVL